ncbi:hypothetical protein [Acidovorax soli]|uniref:Uncharacterized protein n=1 Tax=Acidovorax soli TaxID=592050 RepID=A0A1H4C293_9BURK|nr:hypothetical protein [Acidovorax soli]SEA54506.1 hypothetical protein SAMN05421875_1171 [Acidovorax soli]
MIGLEVISTEELTNLIGSIYNCALDPQRWQSTCQKIAEFSKSAAGGIFVHDLRNVQNKQSFAFGYQPEFFQMLKNHYAENSMAAANIDSNNGDLRAFSMERYQLLETRFFQEVADSKVKCNTCQPVRSADALLPFAVPPAPA